MQGWAVAQLVVCLPGMHSSASSVIRVNRLQLGGTCLQSQRQGDQKVKVSPSYIMSLTLIWATRRPRLKGGKEWGACSVLHLPVEILSEGKKQVHACLGHTAF